MAQCRGIIDDQQLSKDVCAAGLLYSICFRDGINALGWTPIAGTDASRKNLQDARDWLLAHLGTNNTIETLLNAPESQNFTRIYNDTASINKSNTKYNRIDEETGMENGNEYATVQTLPESIENKINVSKSMVTDIASAYFYNITNTNNSVNMVVTKTAELNISFIIKNNKMSELTAHDTVEDAIQKRNLMITAPQIERGANSSKILLQKFINKTEPDVATHSTDNTQKK